MKKAIILMLVTALVTGIACHFLFQTRPAPLEPRLLVESPDQKFTAAIGTNESGSGDAHYDVQSVSIIRKGVKEENWIGLPGSDVAVIHSCANADLEVRWVSATTLLIRYSQSKPNWVTTMKTVDGISVLFEEVKKPNQTPGLENAKSNGPS